MRLSKETKIQFLLNFNKFDSPTLLQRYLKSLNRNQVPTRSTIQNFIKKFKQTGSQNFSDQEDQKKLQMNKKRNSGDFSPKYL